MCKPAPVDWRCGILDVLEAAALHQAQVDIRIHGAWRRLRVADVVSERGGDWLIAADSERIMVAAIEQVRPTES